MATLTSYPQQRYRGFCQPNDQFMGNLEAIDADFEVVKDDEVLELDKKKLPDLRKEEKK